MMNPVEELAIWTFGIVMIGGILTCIPPMVESHRTKKAFEKCRNWSDEKLAVRRSYLHNWDDVKSQIETSVIMDIQEERMERRLRVSANNEWQEWKDKE